MRAPELLDILEWFGFNVTSNAGRLMVRPGSLLTDEIRRLICDSKDNILELFEAKAVLDGSDAEDATEPTACPEDPCTTCANSRRPGASRYCSDRPDLPPAYGARHPLRQLPDDGGASCTSWVGFAAQLAK
jgi:hypothetical protein